VPFAASVLMALIEGSMVQSRLAPEDVRLDGQVENLAALLTGWIEGPA
jgi:hypothetical protein